MEPGQVRAGGRRGAPVREPRARPRYAGRASSGAADRAHADLVQPPGALSPQSEEGADPGLHLHGGVGLRLRPDVELAHRLHRLPATEDRSGRRAAADPHHPWSRLRAPRAGIALKQPFLALLRDLLLSFSQALTDS